MYIPVEIRSLIIKSLQEQLRKERYERNRKKLECELRFPKEWFHEDSPLYYFTLFEDDMNEKQIHQWDYCQEENILSHYYMYKDDIFKTYMY